MICTGRGFEKDRRLYRLEGSIAAIQLCDVSSCLELSLFDNEFKSYSKEENRVELYRIEEYRIFFDNL